MSTMPVPKYFLTKALLHARLQREFRPGAKLPAEHQLALEFGVSRVTVKQGLALLEREGVIKREQGRGTFYLGERSKRAEFTVSTLLESALNYRGGEHARALSARTVLAADRIADCLGVAPGSTVVLVEGLELIDDEPVTFILSYLPEEFGAKILHESEDLAKQTIVSVLAERYGVRVASATHTIRAALADPSFADHLGVEVGSPVLEVERTFFDADKRTVNFSIAFYRADRYRFRVPIGGWDRPE